MRVSQFCFLFIVFFGCSLSSFGQRGTVAKVAGEMVLKSGTEIVAEMGAKELAETAAQDYAYQAWRKSLAQGASLYLLPNNSVRQELALGAGRSEIGTPDYLNYHKWKDRTRLLKNEELGDKITALILRSDKTYPSFPAYYRSFPDMWHGLPSRQRSLGPYEGILEGAYGPEASYEGYFLTTLDEVFSLVNQPVLQPVSASRALDDALMQAFAKKNGFLVIKVGGNEIRPKDVLLIDLFSKQFISLRQTQKSLWAERSTLEHSTPEIEPGYFVNFQGVPSGVLDHRSTSGIILGVNYIAPKAVKTLPLPARVEKPGMKPAVALNENFTVMISHDGKKWAVFSMDSKEGKEIFQAFNKGYYIYFEPKDFPPASSSPWEEIDGNTYWEPHDYILSFSTKKGGPLFGTVEEVRQYVAVSKN